MSQPAELFCSAPGCANKIPNERARRSAHTCSHRCTIKMRGWHAVNSSYGYNGDPLPAIQLPVCLMCGTPIEQLRAQRQGQGTGAAPTCSQRCKDSYRQWRLERLREQRCPKCNHPSTPEEWELFRAWRLRTFGSVQKGWKTRKGNPQWESKANSFRGTLQLAEEALDQAIMELDPPEKQGGKMEPHLERTVTALRIVLKRVHDQIHEQLPESDYARRKRSRQRRIASSSGGS